MAKNTKVYYVPLSLRHFFDAVSCSRYITTLQGSVKRYLFQQELEAYKKLRSEDKASKLLKTVFKAITTQHRFEFHSFLKISFT